ncbi:MAG: amidohydrolase family protein [Acidobacteria bacterium]|nr:amidohydrolase family protein [Acidobacteriota bacterium]
MFRERSRDRRIAATVIATLALALHSPASGIPSQLEEASSALVLRNARILSMAAELSDRAPLLPSGTIVVQNGVIARIGQDEDEALPEDARIIDLAGAVVMPGLADMHAHIAENDLDLFLAHGVTTAREMNGSARHLEWRRQIEAGERRGPRLFVTSTLLAGEPVDGVRFELVTDPDQARELARSAANVGYDMLKVYDGLGASTYEALAGEAALLDLPMTGHVPSAVGVAGVLASRQHLEHTEKLVHAGVGIEELVEQIRVAEVWLTPTLAVQEALSLAGTLEYSAALDDPSMEFMPAGILGWWHSLAGQRPTPTQTSPFVERQQLLLRAAYDAGVPLLAGSDTPNPLMVPGLSLVDELEALVRGGLSAHAALVTATNAAGRFATTVLKSPDSFGVVEVGAAADLVILEQDPREMLSTLRAPRAVVAGGTWFDREALDAMLRGVAARRAPAVDGE